MPKKGNGGLFLSEIEQVRKEALPQIAWHEFKRISPGAKISFSLAAEPGKTFVMPFISG